MMSLEIHKTCFDRVAAVIQLSKEKMLEAGQLEAEPCLYCELKVAEVTK